MAITGNGLAGLGQLQRNLRKLAEVPSRAAPTVAYELGRLMAEEFDAGVDPYGNAWAPLAPSTIERGRFDPPLTDTHAMRGGFHAEPQPGAGVAISFDVPYVLPHQTGFRNARTRTRVPARPLLPTNTMPARWNEAIKATVEEAIRGAVEEGG